jgi:hypothetical protein
MVDNTPSSTCGVASDNRPSRWGELGVFKCSFWFAMPVTVSVAAVKNGGE